jgi:hypothetical protein
MCETSQNNMSVQFIRNACYSYSSIFPLSAAKDAQRREREHVVDSERERAEGEREKEPPAINKYSFSVANGKVRPK